MKNYTSQKNPIKHTENEQKMLSKMIALMEANDAPIEQYERLKIKRKQQEPYLAKQEENYESILG